MNQILAVIDRVKGGVPSVANALADVLKAKVRTIRVDFGRADAVARTLRELHRPGVLVGVMANEALSEAVRWDIAWQATTPVVVVPPGVRTLPHGAIARVLLPLDGTPQAAHAVDRAVGLFASAGVDLIVLHVFDVATVPRFWDQPAHARNDFEAEFLARFCAQSCARLELRSGVPGEEVIGVAVAEDVDLIALGWSQRLDPGRAQTVRRTVSESTVPVLLVPMSDGT